LVYDQTTGLTWQQTIGSGSWSEATTYSANLGVGWRLPSLTELQTIVDDTIASPAIDRAAFPDTPAFPLNTPDGNFWTSSEGSGSALATFPDGSTRVVTYAWQVSFANGGTGTNDQALISKLRCVRLGP
jgi:hypothetical protein